MYSLDFLANGQLVSGNNNGKISLWDTVTGSRVRAVNAHSNGITSLSASQSQSKLASGSRDKTVRVWDAVTWECMRTFECHRWVHSVALYRNGDRVAACTWETLFVLDTATQQLIASENLLMHLDLWDSDIAVVAVSRNGKWLAVASKEIISLYDASTLDCLWSRDNQSEFISFSPDDCQLVSGHIYW